MERERDPGTLVPVETDGLMHPTCGGKFCVAGKGAAEHEHETCPLHTGRVLRQVTVAEQQHAVLQAFLVAPARALDLFRRVPELFKRRGWPEDFDGRCVVIAAIGAVKLGALGQRFRLPPELVKHESWFKFAAGVPGGIPTAEQIITHFELQPLLEAP
jgi:hypothetical protein